MHTSHIICHDKDFRCLKMLTASQHAQTRPEALYPSKNALGGKKQRSLSDSTQLTFFSFFCSPHVFKKCQILRQVHVCFFTTGREKLILGRSRNIQKNKKPQKESSLTSTARNRQQSGEHEGIFGVSPSPSHTHKHTLARSPTENLAAVPVSSRNKDTKFERRQLVVVVVLPVTYPTSPSVYLDQHLCLKNVT